VGPFEQPRKKLVEYGWDVPDTAFVRANIQAMEQRCPFFDGVVLRLKGGWTKRPAHIFRTDAVNLAEYTDDIANLQATKFTRFTDNFVLMWGTAEKGWDWFNESHWQAAETNARWIARVARQGGLVGICFDPEPYDGNPWRYPDQPQAATKTFTDYWQRVRECGRRFMRALQSEFPNLRLLTFFQLSLFPDIVDIPDAAERMKRLSQHGYGLLPAFLNGMLDAVNEQVVIVDGNEPAYYYTDAEQYFRAYHLMKQRALTLIAPENRRKYVAQVQAGFALYMDQVFGLRQPKPERFLSFYLTPDERARWFEHNVYWALYTTDEYVWCYSERVDWWGTQGKAPWHNFVPTGAVDAVRSARRKVEQGQPLGFSLRDMVQAATQRLREASK
jgi:PHD/YefM family antitoxin component YafN of YafNO toxin-antitoxin module